MTPHVTAITLEMCYLMTLLGYLSNSNRLPASTGSLSGLAANAFVVLRRCNVGCFGCCALQVAQEARDSRHFRSQLCFGNAVDTHEIWHGIWLAQGCHLTQLLWTMHLYNTVPPLTGPSLPCLSPSLLLSSGLFQFSTLSLKLRVRRFYVLAANQ